MINRTSRLTCVGFTCTTCQTAATCLSQGGQVSGTQCVKCTGNQVLVNGVCACSSGLNLINGVCQTCPQGTIFNALLNICSNVCSTNQVWLNGACQCAQGFNLVNGQCQQLRCASNLFFYLGGCYSCPPGSTASPDQSGCVCLPGYTYISSSSSCILSSSNSSSTVNSSTSTSTSNSSSTTNTSNSSSSSSASSSSSSSNNGIYILPGGSSTTITNTTITNNTSSTNGLISTPTISCPTGAYYTNNTCRSQANFTVYQTAQLSGQNIVYVGIAASNLPNNLPNEAYPFLLVPSIRNSPAGTTVSIAASTFNTNQWIANINYVNNTLPVTLVISLNTTYNAYFTST